jgi:hypothetical protein
MSLKDTFLENFHSDYPELSEGEIYIAEFFRNEGIKFIKQFRIDDLKGDSKDYRIADFYLPKYKLYLEFFGRWNVNEDSRKTYLEKKQVYFLNNKPCIYLYPENLGIIEHTFKYRAKKELKKHRMKWQLFQFRKYLFLKNRGDLFFWFGISLLILIFTDYRKIAEPSTRNSTVFFSGIVIYQLFRFYTGIKRYFIND